MKWLLPAVMLAAAIVIYRRMAAPQPDPGQPPSDDQDQETTALEDLQVTLQNTMTTAPQPLEMIGPTADPIANRRAFLDMIAFSEGTAGPEGYRTMFGYHMFDDFSDHPRQYFSFTNSRGETLKTSAAGRYQFLGKTWDSLAKKLGLPDFSPASQDAAALELVRQRGAIPDVDAGLIDSAIQKCAPIWASLPGAGYAQPERKLSELTAAYFNAGGSIATA